jgi:hypothetical protein
VSKREIDFLAKNETDTIQIFCKPTTDIDEASNIVFVPLAETLFGSMCTMSTANMTAFSNI